MPRFVVVCLRAMVDCIGTATTRLGNDDNFDCGFMSQAGITLLGGDIQHLASDFLCSILIPSRVVAVLSFTCRPVETFITASVY